MNHYPFSRFIDVKPRMDKRRGKILLSLIMGAFLGAPTAKLNAQEIRVIQDHEGEAKLGQATAGLNTPQDYIISLDDELNVYILDVPELSRSYRVSPTGKILVPLIPEPVTAAGLSLGELANNIANRLKSAGMVDNPRVSVQVVESRLHSIAITGAVGKPQMYPVFGKTTLLDALSQAQGLAEDAGNTAVITRGNIGMGRVESPSESQTNARDDSLPASPQTLKVDLTRLMEEGDASLNYDLYPGDRVTVQRAGIVYVVGGVNRAGGFVLKDDREKMTVLKAVALANNLTSTASAKKTVIIRKSKTGSVANMEIPVRLDKILTGKESDRVLLANDILFIPDSNSKKGLFRAGELATQTVAGLIIYRL